MERKDRASLCLSFSAVSSHTCTSAGEVSLLLRSHVPASLSLEKTKSSTQAQLGESRYVFRSKKAQNPTFLVGGLSRNTQLRRKMSFSKSCGKASENSALFATPSLQRTVTMRSAMEHKYPDVQFLVSTAEGDLLLEDCNFESLGQVGHGEFDRLSLGKDPSSESARFHRLCLCLGRSSMCLILQGNFKAGGQTIAKKADQTLRKASTSILVSPPQIKQSVSSTLDDLGQECARETYPPPHRLHGDDQRVGSHRLTRPGRSGSFKQHASGQATGFSSAQDRESVLEVRKVRSRNPNGNWNRKASKILPNQKES